MIGRPEEWIPLSRPDIGPTELERVTAALESGRLALGPQTREFEMRMATITGARHAVAVSSGTAALHLILEGMGIGPRDEVITTPFSFVATANTIQYVGATPVFTDIDPHTLNLDPARVESRISTRTRAILGVDVFGLPADWTELRAVAEQHELILLDDGCESLGGLHKSQAIGSTADATAFGFYPNKQITTGEGGCITTDSDELADICRSLSNQGRSSRDRMHHTRLGYNYRLSEIAAALGCAQLERFEDLQARRQTLASFYEERLEKLTCDIQLPVSTPDRSWFAYVIVLHPSFSPTARDRLIEELAARTIESAPYFPCIHLQPLYTDQYGYARGSFPLAERVSDRSLALPFFPALTDDKVDRVVDALVEILPSLPRTTRTIVARA